MRESSIAVEYDKKVTIVYKSMNVTMEDTSIHLNIITPSNQPLMVYARYNAYPNETTHQWDYMQEIPQCECLYVGLAL